MWEDFLNPADISHASLYFLFPTQTMQIASKPFTQPGQVATVNHLQISDSHVCSSVFISTTEILV